MRYHVTVDQKRYRTSRRSTASQFSAAHPTTRHGLLAFEPLVELGTVALLAGMALFALSALDMHPSGSGFGASSDNPATENDYNNTVFSVQATASGEMLEKSMRFGLRIWDRTGNIVLQQIDLPHFEISTGAMSEDGHMVVVCHYGGEISVIDLETETIRTAMSSGKRTHARSVSISPDGSTFVIGYSESSAEVWDATSLVQVDCLKLPLKNASYVNFNQDGTRLTCANMTEGFCQYAWPSRELLTVSDSGLRFVTGMAASPDGKRMAFSMMGRKVQVFDSATGTQLWAARSNNTAVMAVAFAPDGETLASAGSDGIVEEWDAKSGTLRRSFTGDHCNVGSLDYSRDGELLYLGGHDGQTRVCQTAAWSQLP